MTRAIWKNKTGKVYKVMGVGYGKIYNDLLGTANTTFW